MTPGKTLYGSLFVLGLPALLFLWAAGARNNVAMPVYGGPLLGSAFVLGGLGLMTKAMLELKRIGGGLPMNAYPPPNLVVQGTFRWIPHPIYTAFIAVCLGASMIARSAAGLWLVTPAMALGCAALVIGYERLDLQRRFGQTLHLLPAAEDAPVTGGDWIRYQFGVALPWLALYLFTIHIPEHGVAFRFGFEKNLPIFSWTTVIYESTYVTAALAPLFARTRRDLRRLMISVWAAMAVVFPFYWIFPSAAPRRPLPAAGWSASLLFLERNTYPPAAALPSFHVLWAIFVGRLWRPRRLGIAYAAAVAVSCVTTGMHYIPDVLAAVVIAPALLEPQRAWKRVRRAAEILANSWKEWRIGPVRVINHGFYAGAAAFVQVAIVSAAAGSGREWKVLATAAAGLAGAALWAQWLEGSSRLRRPFGFYGGFIGVAIACLFFEERWILLAGHCLGAPWMQAIGRLRCLVNGCCHGAPAPESAGIRVTHERSRVTRLATLSGVPIHPTQLYSILSNVFLGLILARLWLSGCPLAIVCGAYGLGSGVFRFAEEAYRGEPQTPILLGLRMYQWLALGTAILGAVLTTLPSPGPPALAPTVPGFRGAASFGLLCAVAMGVDFPESGRPLAQLT
jgi:protein-S-isoprenylcysteine O-methyltransferase Ste14